MFTPLISGGPLSIAMFGISSTFHSLVAGGWGGGGLVCQSVGKADLLSDHFDGKQSWKSVDLPITYHPSPSLITSAIKSR